MTPPLLLAASLVLWGVSIGQTWIGVALALTVESFRLARLATPPSGRIVAATVRVTLLASLGALGYVAVARNFPQAIYDWLRWLPMLLLPLPAMQRLAGGSLPFGSRNLETTHGYAAVALAAAGTGTGAGPWLYPAYAAIAAWALAARTPRARLSLAVTLAVVAAAIGQAVHVGVFELQGQVEEWSTEFFQDLFDPKTDIFRERTRIGELGRVRLSDRIVMRVAVPEPRPAEILLREVAFERYRNGEWNAASRNPEPVAHDAGRWVLAPGPSPRRLTLRRSSSAPEGLLPLPAQARALERLPVESLERMPTGAVRAHGLPRLLDFDAEYGGDGADSAPGPVDLEVPEVLVDAIDRVIADERLGKGDAAATIAAVRGFFDANYAYTLELSRSPGAPPRTLGDFLLVDRKGHCEYFATASALVLRRLGIPARYVAGYSAQEWSALEKAFVVRGRHAHAWTLAFVDGRWVEVDTTPSRWAEVEEREMHGFLGALRDRLSWAFDRLLRWWFGDDYDLTGLRTPAFVLAAIAVVALAIVLVRRRRKAAAAAPARKDELALAWSTLESAMARAGHARQAGETPREWAARLWRERPEEAWRVKLVALVRDYYVARFDPASGSTAAKTFTAAAARWEAPT